MTEQEVAVTGPVKTLVKWTPLVRAALRAEVRRRNALIDPNEIPRQRQWDVGSVSEVLLREALGVGNEVASH